MGMTDGIMLCKFIAKLGISGRLIGHDVTFAVEIGANDREDFLYRDILDMEGTGSVAPLNEVKTTCL